MSAPDTGVLDYTFERKREGPGMAVIVYPDGSIPGGQGGAKSHIRGDDQDPLIQ